MILFNYSLTGNFFKIIFVRVRNDCSFIVMPVIKVLLLAGCPCPAPFLYKKQITLRRQDVWYLKGFF